MPSKHTTLSTSIKLCECGCGEPAPIASRTNSAKGHVKGQPVRFIVGHHLRGRPNWRKGKFRPIVPRFWAWVDKKGPDECWSWIGNLESTGYGRIYYQGKTRKAHRLSWELHYGTIPDGMFVCHHCDNPACVNPAHLFLGKPADNSNDMVSKGRAASGEKHGTCKLKEVDIPTIRQMAAAGLTYTEIGKRYEVAYGVISRAVRCETWKHVQ